MEVEFMDISIEPQHKEMHLQHIYNMINVKLIKGDTYNSLFSKLEERFKDKPKELEAVKSWILFNKESQDDQSVFETVICKEEVSYAVFDLIPKK